MREALPVLARAHGRADLSDATRALSEATVLALRLVAAGRTEPVADADRAPHWRIGTLDEDEAARVAEVADRADGFPVARAPGRRGRHPAAVRAHGGAPAGWALRDRLARQRRGADRRPHLVTISLRVEADEEELVAGAVRLVLQVHDEQDPLHVRDAVDLWTRTEEEHGFGERARVHATLALRGAAEGWPVLDRLLELQVPDQITLDTDELVSLLDDGVAALRDRGVDVLWPRSLGRDLTTTTVLDRRPGEHARGAAGRGAAGQRGAVLLPLAGRPARRAAVGRRDGAAGGGDQAAAEAAGPVDGRRPRRGPAGEAAPGPHGQAGGGGRGGADRRRGGGRRRPRRRRGGVVARGARAAAHRGHPRADRAAGRSARDAARLPAPRPDLARPAHRPRARRLPGRRHGAGQDRDPDRPAPPPGRTGPTLVVCPASLLGTWEAEIHRFAPGSPVRRFHGSAARPDGSTRRRVRADDVRHHARLARRPSPRWPGTSWSPTRPSTSRTPGPRPRGRCARSRARPGWR